MQIHALFLSFFLTTQGTKSQLSDKRIHQVFITKNKIKLHADINGSFNIVRKVLKSFQYEKEKMSLLNEKVNSIN